MNDLVTIYIKVKSAVWDTHALYMKMKIKEGIKGKETCLPTF